MKVYISYICITIYIYLGDPMVQYDIDRSLWWRQDQSSEKPLSSSDNNQPALHLLGGTETPVGHMTPSYIYISNYLVTTASNSTPPPLIR